MWHLASCNFKGLSAILTILGPSSHEYSFHVTIYTGALTTAAVLMGGLVAFKKGNKALSQTMMRARIVAQGATVAIMLGTSGTVHLGRPISFTIFHILSHIPPLSHKPRYCLQGLWLLELLLRNMSQVNKKCMYKTK